LDAQIRILANNHATKIPRIFGTRKPHEFSVSKNFSVIEHPKDFPKFSGFSKIGGLNMINSIKAAVTHLKTLSGDIEIIAHHDTDGITSAAILTKALQREERKFNVRILKGINNDVVRGLMKDASKIIFLLDFGSGHVGKFIGRSNVFIIDHHEINVKNIPHEVSVINPLMFNEAQNICASALTYLFAKEMNELNIDLAHLAIIGMISESREAKSFKIGEEILKDSEDLKIRKSILLFPATRPLHKALEFSNIFLPGITGSSEGVSQLLNNAGIKLKEDENHRTLLDLNEEETTKLLEVLCIRKEDETAFGNIYLMKFFNQFEDARELSTLINACGRMDRGYIALEMCLGSKRAKSIAESIYGEYKHLIISSLKTAVSIEKIETENYVIINSGKRINDNLLSVIVSIMSSSFVYSNGKIIVGMADRNDGNIKISSRICGECNDIDLRKVIEPLLKLVNGEGSGNNRSAGGIIPKDKSEEFIELIQRDMGLILKH